MRKDLETKVTPKLSRNNFAKRVVFNLVVEDQPSNPVFWDAAF